MEKERAPFTPPTPLRHTPPWRRRAPNGEAPTAAPGRTPGRCPRGGGGRLAPAGRRVSRPERGEVEGPFSAKRADVGAEIAWRVGPAAPNSFMIGALSGVSDNKSCDPQREKEDPSRPPPGNRYGFLGWCLRVGPTERSQGVRNTLDRGRSGRDGAGRTRLLHRQAVLTNEEGHELIVLLRRKAARRLSRHGGSDEAI